MEINDIIKIIKKSNSLNTICNEIYGYCNGKNTKIILNIINTNNIDTSHFDSKKNLRKYEIIEKKCPICNTVFETKKEHRDEKTVCSRSCSNKYFKNGLNNIDFDINKKIQTYEKVSKTLSELNNNKIKKEIVIKNKRQTFTKEETKIIIKINAKNKKNKLQSEISDKKCKECLIFLNMYQLQNNNLYCSNTCARKNISLETKLKLSNNIQERIKKGLHKGFATRNIISYPEQFFIAVLDNNNIKYKHNYRVSKKDLGLNDNSGYFLDFYLTDYNIDLEIDGNQHKYRQDHDITRDKLLTDAGYDVYRIIWKSINNDIGKKYIKEEIEKLLQKIKEKN